jgi:hypothetical protein
VTFDAAREEFDCRLGVVLDEREFAASELAAGVPRAPPRAMRPAWARR